MGRGTLPDLQMNIRKISNHFYLQLDHRGMSFLLRMLLLIAEILVTFLESVPDAEAFYENPGTYSPHYHVLENLRDSRDVSSSASYPSGSHMDQETQGDFHHDSSEEEEDQNSYNDTCTNDDQPIYTNPTSPVSTAGSMQDGNFSFEQPDTNYYQDEEDEASFDGAPEHSEDWDIYANSEAIRNSHLEDGAINNPGYMSDEEDERNTNPNISTDEPIYDNQIDIDDGHNKSGATPYALLRDQPKEGVYEDLRGNKSGVTTSDYQSLSPKTTRKKKPKIKPKPARKQWDYLTVNNIKIDDFETDS